MQFDSQVVTFSEWHFSNTIWNQTAKKQKKDAELQKTVKDPFTQVQITDFSENQSDYVRDYQLEFNSTYTIRDTVEVIDPWSIAQTVQYTDSLGYLKWLMISVYYDGDKWRQSFSWDGESQKDVESSASEDLHAFKLLDESNANLSLNQQVDFAG